MFVQMKKKEEEDKARKQKEIEKKKKRDEERKERDEYLFMKMLSSRQPPKKKLHCSENWNFETPKSIRQMKNEMKHGIESDIENAVEALLGKWNTASVKISTTDRNEIDNSNDQITSYLISIDNFFLNPERIIQALDETPKLRCSKETCGNFKDVLLNSCMVNTAMKNYVMFEICTCSMYISAAVFSWRRRYDSTTTQRIIQGEERIAISHLNSLIIWTNI